MTQHSLMSHIPFHAGEHVNSTQHYEVHMLTTGPPTSKQSSKNVVVLGEEAWNDWIAFSFISLHFEDTNRVTQLTFSSYLKEPPCPHSLLSSSSDAPRHFSGPWSKFESSNKPLDFHDFSRRYDQHWHDFFPDLLDKHTLEETVQVIRPCTGGSVADPQGRRLYPHRRGSPKEAPPPSRPAAAPDGPKHGK